jgi:phospholipid/cholesterol/gamma-HCH transport system permease protein
MHESWPRLLLRRLDEVVWGSLLLVTVSVGCIGAAMADQAGRQAMRLLGDQSFIGLEYPVLGVQEFCPLVVALVLALRIGAGFSAELASLRADDTFDALTVMGLRPWRTRIVPMLVALPLGAVVLSLTSVLSWEAAGVLVMLGRSGINPFTFVHPEVLSPSLLLLLCAKSAAFGASVGAGATVAAMGSVLPGDVGQTVTRGVVLGTLCALTVNLVFDVGWHLT